MLHKKSSRLRSWIVRAWIIRYFDCVICLSLIGQIKHLVACFLFSSLNIYGTGSFLVWFSASFILSNQMDTTGCYTVKTTKSDETRLFRRFLIKLITVISWLRAIGRTDRVLAIRWFRYGDWGPYQPTFRYQPLLRIQTARRPSCAREQRRISFAKHALLK